MNFAAIYTNRLERIRGFRSKLRANHTFKTPSQRRIRTAVQLEENIGRFVYFHDAWGTTNSGLGIARETQIFEITGVQHLRDGAIAYRLRLEAEGDDAYGYTASVDEVTLVPEDRVLITNPKHEWFGKICMIDALKKDRLVLSRRDEYVYAKLNDVRFVEVANA